MKYGFPLGHTLIFLAWGMIDYKDAYVAAGEYQNGLDSIRWGTDWILKVPTCFVSANSDCPSDSFRFLFQGDEIG